MAREAAGEAEKRPRGSTGFGAGLRKRDKTRDVCTGALQKRINRRSGHDAQEAAVVENILAGIRAGSARIAPVVARAGSALTRGNSLLHIFRRGLRN
jgi:hypothetical protein